VKSELVLAILPGFLGRNGSPFKASYLFCGGFKCLSKVAILIQRLNASPRCSPRPSYQAGKHRLFSWQPVSGIGYRRFDLPRGLRQFSKAKLPVRAAGRGRTAIEARREIETECKCAGRRIPGGSHYRRTTTEFYFRLYNGSFGHCSL